MNSCRLPALIFLASFAGFAWAHAGAATPTFWSSVLHPFEGLDHLFAMLAVGLWASSGSASASARLALPGLFVAGTFAGIGLGLLDVLGLGIETAVAVSLLAMGLAQLCGVRGGHLLSLGLALPCGLLHGGAHGAEMAGLAGGAAIAGFLAGTVLLHALGAALVLTLPSARRRLALAGSGASVAMAGLWLLA